MEVLVDTPILRDNEEDKEKSPSTTPVSEKPNRLPGLLRSRAFGTRLDEITDSAYRILLLWALLYKCFD